MQIRFRCPTDLCVAIIEYEPLEHCPGSIQCPRCRRSHPVTITDTMRTRNMVDRCAICNCRELFTRKDFPQAIGVLIVVVSGALALYCFRTSVIAAWAVLASAVLIDAVIYLFTGRVTTCYACRAEYRKCALDPTHQDFDLATSEKY